MRLVDTLGMHGTLPGWLSSCEHQSHGPAAKGIKVNSSSLHIERRLHTVGIAFFQRTCLTFASWTAEGIPEDPLLQRAIELLQRRAGIQAHPVAVDALAVLVHALLFGQHDFAVLSRWGSAV